MRTVNDALLFAQHQHTKLVLPADIARQGWHDWEGACQAFVRSCYGIPALFGSAWAQWLGADTEDRHPGGNPSDAPLGSALLFKGAGPNGHIDLAARMFPSGSSAAWSNDLLRHGQIDKVTRNAPVVKWAQGYLGYLTAVNDVDLPLHNPVAVAKPKSARRYIAIDKAVGRLENALTTAKAAHDSADVKALTKEVADLKHLYATLRRK